MLSRLVTMSPLKVEVAFRLSSSCTLIVLQAARDVGVAAVGLAVELAPIAYHHLAPDVELALDGPVDAQIARALDISMDLRPRPYLAYVVGGLGHLIGFSHLRLAVLLSRAVAPAPGGAGCALLVDKVKLLL